LTPLSPGAVEPPIAMAALQDARGAARDRPLSTRPTCGEEQPRPARNREAPVRCRVVLTCAVPSLGQSRAIGSVRTRCLDFPPDAECLCDQHESLRWGALRCSPA
jgi:hypothetical protein